MTIVEGNLFCARCGSWDLHLVGGNSKLMHIVCGHCGDATVPAAVRSPDLGPLPPAPTSERRFLGGANIPTTYEAIKAYVATLPDGMCVNLPAGTVLREEQAK